MKKIHNIACLFVVVAVVVEYANAISEHEPFLVYGTLERIHISTSDIDI